MMARYVEENGSWTIWRSQIALVILSSLCACAVATSRDQAEVMPADDAAIRLEIQLGHSKEVRFATFSPDGRSVLTGSWDGTARLWDAATGRELQRFSGHLGEVGTAAFSPDGRSVLTGSWDGTARLWDAATGRELRRYVDSETDPVRSVAFSPDGRSVLTAVGKSAHLWDATTGRALQRFEDPDTEEVMSAVFSPDGHSVLVEGWNDSSLWDVATGRELRRFDVIGLHSMTFSQDGRLVLAASGTPQICLWDATTGHKLPCFASGIDTVNTLALSPDGRSVLAGGKDKTARLLDVETGRELWRFKGYGEVSSVAFSPDGRWALTAGGDETARLWDATTGQELRRFEGHSSVVRSVAFAPDGRSVLTAVGRTACLWDLATGRELRRFEGHSGEVRSVTFSPDGRWVLTAGQDGTARLWDVATGRELRRFERYIEVRSVAFSPDGRLMLSVVSQEATLWDITTGRELRRFKGSGGGVSSVAFSPDGRSVLIGHWLHDTSLWDVATGRELQYFEGHTEEVSSVAFSPDGRWVLTAGQDETARLWDVATGRELRRFVDHSGEVRSVAFAPDGRSVLTAVGRTARLWDTTTGRELRSFVGHIGEINSVAFAPDGRAVLTAGEDKAVRLWDVQTGQGLARLASFTDGTWAVIDAEGRFDAARAGDVEGLHWMKGLEPISLSQLKDRYYEPGLLAKKLGFNPEPLRAVVAFTAPALYPDVTVSQPTAKDPVLRVTLTNRGGGIGRVVVAINGKEMSADARPRGANPEAQSLKLEVPLASYQAWLKDRNSIHVIAHNAEGYLASRAAEVLYEQASITTRSDITLWAIVVGVSDYAGGEQIDLRYAAKDAADIAKAIGLGGRRLFGADHVRVTTLTTDQTDEKGRPTKANIQTAFKALTTAKPDDVLFVYFSGHGVAVQDVYYFPTQEAHTTNLDDPEVRKQRAVSSEEIVQWLKESPATQRQVLILDTCAAGAAAKSLVDHRNVPSDQIRALDRLKDRTGVHVLMGSAADRVSYEATQFEQGLLTHALLRGMKGAALREEAYVDVTLLFNYVADEVPRLAAHIGGIQRPHIAAPRAVNVESFDIGRLTGDDRQAIPLRTPKPMLLRPTLLNEQVAYDDLGLETKLRARLREDSFARARGSEMAIVLVEADELPGAIKPSGLYSVSGGLLRAKIILRRDDRTKELLVEGTRADLEGFIEKTAQAVTRAVNGWK